MESEKENGEKVVVATVATAEKTEKKKKTAIAVEGKRRSARIFENQCSIPTRHLRRLKFLFWPSPEPAQKKPRRNRQQAPQQQQKHSLRLNGLTLEQVYDSPNIYMIDNFLKDSELDYLDGLIRATRTRKPPHPEGEKKKRRRIKFQKSYVDLEEGDGGDGSIVLDDQRTSTFLSLEKLGRAPLAAMETRAADLLGLLVEQIEPLQLVRYKPDQFFGIHHDLGSYVEDEERVTLPPKTSLCRRRLVTLFCYINTLPDDAGGATYFPKANHLRLIPRRGRAVLFCNILEDGTPDPMVIHAGEAVTSQEHFKYGLNIWACEE